MQTLLLINSRVSSNSLFNGEKKSRDDLPACALTSTSHNESVPCLRSSRMYTCQSALFWSSHLSSLMKWQLTFSPAMPSRGLHRRTCRCSRKIPANLAHLWNWLRLSPVVPNERWKNIFFVSLKMKTPQCLKITQKISHLNSHYAACFTCFANYEIFWSGFQTLWMTEKRRNSHR